MLKALMIVSAMSGDYTVPMKDMNTCLSAKVEVTKQDEDVKVLCIPRADKHEESHAKMEKMFNFFLGVVSQLREQHHDYCFERPFHEECPVSGIR